MYRNYLAAFALGCLMGVSPCLVASLADGKLRSVPAGGTYLYFVHDPNWVEDASMWSGNMGVAGESTDLIFKHHTDLLRVRRLLIGVAADEVKAIQQEPIRGSR